MLKYMSAKEIAEKWNISQRRVSALCSENRIEGAMMVGNMWIIPSNAEKPKDLRATKIAEKEKLSLKPFVKWVGGKGHLIDELNRLIVKKASQKYCEPMVGGGALFFNVLTTQSFEQLYVSDINSELINAYNVIKSNVSELVAKLTELQMTYLPMDESGRKYYYYLIRDKFNSLKLCNETKTDKAVYFIFLNKTCFNGLYRVNKKGEFNVPMGSYKNPTICDEVNLRNISKALQNVTIVCGDYELSQSFIDKDTFVYIDPPYRPISQTAGFTAYNTDSFDDDEQIRLSKFIDKINAVGARIVLSNSDPKNINPDDNFFDSLYSRYKIKRITANRSINSKADKRGQITELLITNIGE